MTVYINGRFSCQPLSGVQRFSSEILDALDRQLERDPSLRDVFGEVIALRPRGESREVSWRNISVQSVGTSQGHIWEQGALYQASKNGVLVSLGNAGPVRHWAQILALHDANIWDIPSAFSSSYRMLHKAIRPVLARRAQRLITASRYSARRLAHHLDVPAGEFRIIPNGADHIFRQRRESSTLDRYGLDPKGYLLSVGNQSPNKNIARLIEAHGMAGNTVPPLVVAGGYANGLENQNHRNTTDVFLLGRVNDDELRSLYEGAFGFVFPSIYEGFGIPPLEAMRLGTPVLAGERSALPEVLKDGVKWFDPLSTEKMAVALEEFSTLSDPARAALINRGREVAQMYTWAKSAKLLAEEIVSLKVTKPTAAQGIRRDNKGLARIGS